MIQNEIRILIVEDEEIWAKAISLDLNDFGYSVVGIAANFEAAVMLLKETDTYDIVLVDIRLNGSNMGIEVGRLINTLYKKPFIFMTASHGSHTLEAVQDVQPFAYLPKPVNPSSLLIAIQNALQNFAERARAKTGVTPNEESHYFFVKNGNKYIRIAWGDVVHLRADKNYTYLLNSKDKTEYPIRSSLAKTQDHIVPAGIKNQFVQITRSEMLQLSFIVELSGADIATRFGNYTCSDVYIKDVKSKLKIIV